MKIIFRCDPAFEALLPKPQPARRCLPDWLRTMPASAFSVLHGQEIRTVKQCPPFVDAMSLGFTILLPCDVMVRDGGLSWDWPLPEPTVPGHPRAPISFHAPAQTAGSPLHQEGQVSVKFNSFWTIELEPGWSLFATHPVNRLDLPFRLVSGLVDADRFHDVGIFFPAIWTDPQFTGRLAKGTPIAQCFPVRRELPELVYQTMTAEQAGRYSETGAAILANPGVYRKRFRVRRGSLNSVRAETGTDQPASS